VALHQSWDAPDRSPQDLDPEIVGHLQELMRGVVTDGSGTELADTLGGPVHGKIGTAEFGEDNPRQTHAWFIGWQGDVALAVLVGEGRSGAASRRPSRRTSSPPSRTARKFCKERLLPAPQGPGQAGGQGRRWVTEVRVVGSI
jgi:membrane peptidoglycan carboxypeptidase